MEGWRKETKKESTIANSKAEVTHSGRHCHSQRPLLTIAVPLPTITSNSWCHYLCMSNTWAPVDFFDVTAAT
eukprot:scaffold20102_cov32-Prasinocladus_malaysianus.AAC.1